MQARKVLLAVERAQARKRKVFLAFEQVQARKVLLAVERAQARKRKVLLAVERVQARESPSRRRASSGKIKSFSPSSEFKPDEILLVLNEFRYGVEGGKSLKDG